MSILIERRLGTAQYWMPVERGWVTPNQEVRIVASPTPAQLRAHAGVMFVDALLASTILDTAMIVTAHAVVAERISLLTMVTSDRPDAIESATIAVPGVSLTGRAVAEIVIPEFYGITVKEWLNEPADIGPETVLVTEDERALLPTASDSDFHEDLGRAWFLMTETPFVSHICLVPAERYRNEPDSVRAAVNDLNAMQAAAANQRRLLRRNISRDHDIDRDLVVDVFDGLKFDLTESGLAGLTTLYRQTGVLGRIGPIAEKLVKHP